MPSLNRVELMGHLGKDPEVRFTPTGKKVTQFSLAVNRIWKDSAGQKQTATDWFQVEAWGRLGEICHQYLKKGSLAFLEGRLRTDQWQDKEKGDTHYRTLIVAQGMQMLGRPPEEPAELVEAGEEPEGD